MGKSEHEDILAIVQTLVDSGHFTADLLRAFHCECCRDVREFIVNRNVRTAIEVAERYCQGKSSQEELALQHERMKAAADAYWRNVLALKQGNEPGEHIWPVSEEVDRAWLEYLGAECAKTATQASLDALTIPDAASSLRACALARPQVAAQSEQTGDPPRALVERRWQEIHEAETAKQVEILRSLIGELPDQRTP